MVEDSGLGPEIIRLGHSRHADRQYVCVKHRYRRYQFGWSSRAAIDNITFVNNTFTANSSQFGGGIYVHGVNAKLVLVRKPVFQASASVSER